MKWKICYKGFEIEDFRDEKDKVIISLLIGSGYVRLWKKLELWKLRICFALYSMKVRKFVEAKNTK